MQPSQTTTAGLSIQQGQRYSRTIVEKYFQAIGLDVNLNDFNLRMITMQYLENL
jgi:hypothetical protein